MKRAAALACLPFVAFIATATFAQDKPLFVYVSPNPIGVNDFLKLGKIGTERVAQELGGLAKTYESSDPTTQRQNLEAAGKAGATVVVAIGFEFNDMLPDVATAYPKVKFLQVDSCPFDKLKPNIRVGRDVDEKRLVLGVTRCRDERDKGKAGKRCGAFHGLPSRLNFGGICVPL